MKQVKMLLIATVVLMARGSALGQAPPAEAGSASQLAESGHIATDTGSAAYLIRRLPVSSFPDLPDATTRVLSERACMIPQTYQAHHPENVVHASLERAGSSDWAVLCSAHGTVSLLVFFASAPARPATLKSAPEMQRLQVHDSSKVLGFNWAIDPASPQQIREAQSALEHHMPLLDHDALADTVLDRRTIYHLFAKNAWTLVEMPE